MDRVDTTKPTITRLDVGGSTQAGVLLARKGQLLPSDDMYPCLPVLYHIAFHSLGSRLFHIREKTGLFYGAQGILGSGSRPGHPGMDIVCTTVEPCDAERTVSILQNMLTCLGREPNITQRELNAAQRWYEHTVIDTLNSPAKFASFVVGYKRLYNTVEYKPILLRHMRQIKNLDVATVNALASTVFAAPYDLQIIAH